MDKKPKPITVELIGELEVGKSHSGATPDGLLFIDTSIFHEADVIVEKLHPNENIDDIYFHCITFKDIIEALRCISDTTKTVTIDSGADLRRIVGAEWKKRNDRKGIHPYEYGEIDEIVLTEILGAIIKKNKNLILTAKMKDEYIGEGDDAKKTGRRERYGFGKMDFAADIRIYMYIEGDKRKNTVIKNRFIDRESKDYIKSLPEVTWKEIQKITKLPPERLI